MSVLERHERFEIEVLDALRRARALDGVVFGGGTMLRLCHQAERYSVDLGFFLKQPRLFFLEQFIGGGFQRLKSLFLLVDALKLHQQLRFTLLEDPGTLEQLVTGLQSR